MTADQSTIVESPTRRQRHPVTRYLEAVGFVAIWIAIGLWLRSCIQDYGTAINAYLLACVPLTILFQSCVRKEPLLRLWIRRPGEPVTIGVSTLVMTLVFSITPVCQFWAEEFRGVSAASFVVAGWYLALILGAFGAAFSLLNTPGRNVRKGLPSFLIAIALGGGIVALAAIATGKSLLSADRGSVFVRQFLLYFPACFVIEEVAFRGMLDPHLEPQSPDRLQNWLSACVVAMLWGIWHIPILPVIETSYLVLQIPAICLIHCMFGIPLSFCSHSAGGLLLPALAHALVDAMRNALLAT